MGYLVVGKYTPEDVENDMPEVIEREYYGQGMIFKDQNNQSADYCYIHTPASSFLLKSVCSMSAAFIRLNIMIMMPVTGTTT